jgi:hypothetical protein
MIVYTLVHHTGLSNAVELRGVTTAEAARIKAAGGVVFDTYREASEAEEAENYPPEVKGLHPHVRGTFVRLRSFGEAIYIPSKVVS